MAERSVSVKLSASVDSYVAAMNKAKASTEGFSRSSQANLEKLGGQMQRVGGTMTRGVTLPLAAAAVAAVASSSSFDTAFRQMVGLAGVAADEVDGLKESVLELAGRTAVAPQELAEALYQAASSGLDTAAAMKAVEVAAVASAAGMGSAGDVVSLVASAVNSYGAANITAAEATDILTATIREGRADPEELAGSLGRVLPVAAAMGVSFEEVGGAVAYLSNIFGDTDRTVTAVNDAFAKLSAPTDGAREALKAAGTSADELQRVIADDGLLAGLELLRDHGFAGNAAAIRELMPDMQGAVALTALLNDESGTLTATMGGVADNTGAAGEAFDAVATGPGFKMRQALTDLKIAFIQAGDVIMPMATGVATVVGGMATKFAALPDAAKMVVLGFLAILAAVGPLLTVGGKLVANMKTITGAFQKFPSAAVGVQSGAVVAMVALIGFSLHAKSAADDARKLSDSLDALARASDAERITAFWQAIVDGVGAGKDMNEVIDEFTRGNIGLTETLIEQMSAQKLAGQTTAQQNVVLDALIAARNREVIAISEQAEAQEKTTATTEQATESTELHAEALTDEEVAASGAFDAQEMRNAAAAAGALIDEAGAEAAEEHAEAMRDQADAYVDNAADALQWMQDVGSAMDSAGGAISTFSEEALSDIDTFQQELEDSIVALYGWQNNLITIAAETSPEFATYLADMGLAGAELVAELAGNTPELQDTFGQWQVASSVASRDMAAEFASVSPAAQAEFERLGRDIASTIEGIGPLTAAEARAVGAAIAAGMASGVDFNAHAVTLAAIAAVRGALIGSQQYMLAHSPSRLFAEEVGAPIAWGIVEGLDEHAQDVVDAAQRVVEGIEKGIESAKKDALDAVDDMVDDVADRFDSMWDVVEGRRDVAGLTERVTDAERELAEVMADPDRTGDEVAKATKRLEDANYGLLKASQALLDQGPAGLASFRALAVAAGLEGAEIGNLILAYQDLQAARAAAIAQQAAINVEATAAQDTRARFGQAAASGLANDWIDHIASFAHDPAFQIELMNAFLATLPTMHTGGVVPGQIGRPTPIMALGGEYVTPHTMTATGSVPAVSGAAVTVNLSVQTWDGTISPVAVDRLVEAVNKGIRTGTSQLVRQ